jgi:methylated-DNA-protein-cysteine methyltransferase-like protein
LAVPQGVSAGWGEDVSHVPDTEVTPPPFHRLVYRVVRRVPRGRVVTYGQVAAILGRPRGARAVGMALGALRPPLIDLVPWQRVVGADGRCSHRDGFWADIQREFLEAEGVRFDGRGRVDLRCARWKGPRRGARVSESPARRRRTRRRRT